MSIVLAAAPALRARGIGPQVNRTVRVKIAVDEEYRRRPPQFLETRKWVSAASYFFEKHFGLAFQVDELKFWSSDNTKSTLSSLFQDLYGDIDRGQSDIVLGFTGQVRGESEVGGVASYRHGYALIRSMKSEYVIRMTVVHEICHLFGAVDLEGGSSIMRKDEPQFECDEFTRRIVLVNAGRTFDPATFPLSGREMDAAMSLYQARKRLGRGEAGVSLMLAIFYLERKDYGAAIAECLEAERIAPQDPAIQRLLRLAQQRR